MYPILTFSWNIRLREMSFQGPNFSISLINCVCALDLLFPGKWDQEKCFFKDLRWIILHWNWLFQSDMNKVELCSWYMMYRWENHEDKEAKSLMHWRGSDRILSDHDEIETTYDNQFHICLPKESLSILHTLSCIINHDRASWSFLTSSSTHLLILLVVGYAAFDVIN